ncbi:hypothetical protein [Methylorubrum sp. SB2]|uniref:hypothetical protein n=1 Tax=Methylorubrum subtropicum TaxID=3138812 RepID=UPI00313BC916
MTAQVIEAAAEPLWAKPSRKRVAIALLVAALVPTALFVSLFLLPIRHHSDMPFGRFVVLFAFWMTAGLTRIVPAIFVGGLIYAILAGRVHRDSPALLIACLLTGGLAAIPIDIWIGLRDLMGPAPESRFSFADAVGSIYLDGARTAYGWRDYAANTGKTFTYGMLGGAIFWWIARPKRHATQSSALQ